jgi:hypothetical protein
MEKYATWLELQMVSHYNSLSERGKRSYAAIESLKLGWGGKSYLCKLFKMSINRLNRGLCEVLSPETCVKVVAGKVRASGGGRKKFCDPC